MNEDTELLKSMVTDPYIGKWIYSGHSICYVIDVYGGPGSNKPDSEETYSVISYRSYGLFLCGLWRSIAMAEYLIGGPPDLTPRHKREFNDLLGSNEYPRILI